MSSPKEVSLVADLAHVVYSAVTNDRLMHALSACVEVEQLALIDGTPVAVTPDKALDAFLEHRLAVERVDNSPQLSQRLELLEGRLVAEALGEALTTVLRHCDAVPTPNLARWASSTSRPSPPTPSSNTSSASRGDGQRPCARRTDSSSSGW